MSASNPFDIACSMREQGHPIRQIQEAVGAPYSTVQRWVRDVVPPQPPRLTIRAADNLVRLTRAAMALLSVKAGAAVELIPPVGGRGQKGWFLDIRPTAPRTLSVIDAELAKFTCGYPIAPRYFRGGELLTLEIAPEPIAPGYYALLVIPYADRP